MTQNGHEHRWTEGRPERSATGPSFATLKKATAVIPIVFAVASYAGVVDGRSEYHGSNEPFQGTRGQQGYCFLVAPFGRSREQSCDRFCFFCFMSFFEIT